VRHPRVTSAEFAEFYAASKDRCLRAAVASGLPPAAAEEAVAEAFARAWANWPKVRRLDQPGAWVLRTAVNADISWWRRRRRELAVPDVPDSSIDQPGDPTDLVAAIRALPPRQREVVVLRYLLDLDTAATATSLGISTGTVRATLHHALAALRVQLIPEETNR
jgi:RNA polymerase sigma-70 factor (sigma-E family)